MIWFWQRCLLLILYGAIKRTVSAAFSFLPYHNSSSCTLLKFIIVLGKVSGIQNWIARSCMRGFLVSLVQWVLNYWDDWVQKKFPDNRNPGKFGTTWPYQLANKWEIILLLLRKLAIVESKLWKKSVQNLFLHYILPKI